MKWGESFEPVTPVLTDFNLDFKTPTPKMILTERTN